MVSFVHIADQNDKALMVKNGIRSFKRKSGLRGVYAVPVVPNYATIYTMGQGIKEKRR
jgi:hypothetical protein